MAGKNTSSNGIHQSRKGGFVHEFKLPEHAEKSLAMAIGRQLNSSDTKQITHALASFKTMKNMHNEGEASYQDIKRTLAYVAKCQPLEAASAFANCDETTRALIEESLWFSCALREHGTSALLNPPIAMISLAARQALDDLNSCNQKGGARAKGYQMLFAEYCLASWRQMGGASDTLWHNEASDSLSPLLAWSVALFSVLECVEVFDWRKVQRLLHHIIQRGKVFTL